MPPLQLEGATLGQKHHSFNTRVIEALQNDIPLDSVGSGFSESVVVQLLKIEVANRRRDVKYLVETLKSANMVVVSRAIRGGGWLVIDEQYSHIVEPHFLHNQLLPHMTTRAACKFMLHVRLTLRDERRADQFYKYYEERDLSKALKWLPKCSSDLIAKAIEKHTGLITCDLFKKICKKLPAAFDLFFDNFDGYRRPYLEAVMFLLRVDPLKFLNFMDLFGKYDYYAWPTLYKKQTKFIMKNCPDKILNNFSKYAYNVHAPTVAKHIPPNHVKDFIIKLAQDEDLKFWFSYKHIKPFIHVIPKEEIFKFLRNVFINKESGCGDMGEINLRTKNNTKSENIYQWYRHAPFDVAFTDLKKLLNMESSPEERGAMVRVMLTAAGDNLANIDTVLQYYHYNHINEPFKYKINFINAVISVTKTHTYDENMWKTLDELFHSAEVYIESNNYVSLCLDAIIVYKLLHKQPIPTIVEKKFKFSTFYKIKKRLTEYEKEEIFKYLYNIMVVKINEEKALNEEGAQKQIVHLITMLDLLLEWDKDLINYPFVLDKIKDIAKLKQEKNINVDLNKIYNKKKSWRIHMFEESLLFCNDEKVYINALKHDPSIFQRYGASVTAIQCDDKVRLVRLHSKLTIYWADTLADEWASIYRKRLEKPIGHRSLVLGLCALLPQQELLTIFKKYAPDTPKIVFSEIDNVLLSLRKNIARLMHHACPQPPPSSILQYAQGDYMQYALTSLNAIFYNLPSQKCSEHLPLLFKGSVSLQKHGIRTAFAKLQTDEITKNITNIWNSSNNATVRAMIFKSTIDQFSLKQDKDNSNELWQLLETLMNGLTSEENPEIYKSLTNIKHIPASFQPQFLMKSYKIIRALPGKTNGSEILESLVSSTDNFMDKIDINFANYVLLDYIDRWLVKKKILTHYEGHVEKIKNVLCCYILYCHDEADQNLRLEKVFRPWLKEVLQMWDVIVNKEIIVMFYFLSVVYCLVKHIVKNCENTKNYVQPVKLINNIIEEIESSLSTPVNYESCLILRLSIAYVKCYDKIKEELSVLPEDSERTESTKKKRDQELWTKISPVLASECMNLLKQHKEKYSQSIFVIFGNILSSFLTTVKGSAEDYDFEKALLKHNDIDGHLLTLTFLTYNCYDDEKTAKLDEVRKMILEHPSLEVKMHYENKYKDNPILN